MKHLNNFFPQTSSHRKKCALLVGIAMLLALGSAFAQLAPTNKPTEQFLTDAQVKEKYQNCPDGYYSGPRPGKARYTKDKWLWAVTPEFAKNFCMPPEFVSTELKGAHAVAYKLSENLNEEICGWGGNASVCNTRVEHRFEVYYANKAIPKQREMTYSHLANLSSKMLITQSSKGFDAKIKSVQVKPRIGAMSPFYSQQLGLQSVKDGKIAWPLGTLLPEIYYEEVFEGIDFLALEGGSGFSRLEGWQKSGARKIVISVRKDGGGSDIKAPRSYQMALSDFALVIELPQSMADQVIANDQARGINLKALAEQALRPAPPASTPAPILNSPSR